MGPRAKLEQQERLRSEIPPPPHDYQITHNSTNTSEVAW